MALVSMNQFGRSTMRSLQHRRKKPYKITKNTPQRTECRNNVDVLMSIEEDRQYSFRIMENQTNKTNIWKKLKFKMKPLFTL